MSEQGQFRVASAGWPAAPGTPSAPAASSPWTGRTEIDPEASQAAWFRAAMMADEIQLAYQLVVAQFSEVARGPEAAQPDLHRSAALAEALVLLGRAEEATSGLHDAGVRPPGPGEPISWAQAVLGAARAADGDPGAWAWLTARTADVAPELRLRLTRLVAAAADQRGEPEVADAAWAGVPKLTGAMPSPRLAGRAALAAILRRNREGTPSVIVDGLFEVLTTLRTAALEDEATTTAALRTADELVERGDRAGARLLLRAAAGALPHDRRVTAALRALRPRPTAAALLRGVLVALVSAALVSLGIVLDVRAMGLVGGLVVGLVVRFSPMTGLTLPESQAWRGLRTLRYDPALGRGDTSSASGWYGLAGIGGFVATLTAIAVGLSALGPGGTWPLWATSSAAFLAWIALLAAGSVGSVLLARWARRASGRRRLASRLATARAQAEQHASVCACWEVISTWGPDATLYAERHLVASQEPLPIAVPGAELRRCPTAGVPWLVGPIGRDARYLALRGVVRDAVDDVEAETAGEASVGFYL